MRIKYPAPVSKKWALWEWTDIPSVQNENAVYLRRLRIVQTPWTSLYVHWIYETDSDRWPHDHPWWFASFIMAGWYLEEVHDDEPSGLAPICRMWRRWSVHTMPITRAHRITGISNRLVTVVVTGRRVRDWMFWTPEGQVPWAQLDRFGVDEME